VYGSLIAGFWGFYVWQPIEIDLIPRRLPPKRSVGPSPDELFSPNSRVMVVVAHPDDSEFYIAGTLLRLAQSGAELRQLLFTDGDKSFYFWADTSGLRSTRQREQRSASAKWKAKELTFLGFPDGRLRKNMQTVDAMVATIRRWKPNVVLSFDGDFPPRVSHQDHRRSGDIAEQACAEAKFTGWHLRFATMAPTFAVDVDSVWTERLDLLAIHKSQFSGEKLSRIRAFIADGAVEQAGEQGFSFGEAYRCSRMLGGKIVD